MTGDGEDSMGICLLPGVEEVGWLGRILDGVGFAEGILRVTGFDFGIMEIRGLRQGMADGRGRGIDVGMGGIERIGIEVTVPMREIGRAGKEVEVPISKRLLQRLNMVVVREAF